MKNLAIVHIGGVAKRDEGYATTKGYAKLYLDIAKLFNRVTIFSGFYEKGDPSFHFFNDKLISSRNVDFIVFRNNTPGTRSVEFIRNYLKAALNLWRFVRKHSFFYVVMPSAIGCLAALMCVILGKSYGLYVGGNWGKESRYFVRNTIIRKLIYPINRYAIDNLVSNFAKKAMFALTPGYDLYEEFRRKGVKAYTPIPLLGVSDKDIFYREDTCKDKKINLLFVGELRPAKGVQYLLQALSLVRTQVMPGREIVLTVIGTGQMKDQLRAEARALGLVANVEFAGHISNKKDLLLFYKKSQIFVFPSLSEGFPRVLYESALMSLPIITTSVGGIPYFLRDRIHCLIVPPADAQSISDAVIEIVNNGPLRRSMILNARLLVVKRVFASKREFGTTANQILALFRDHAK